MIKDNIKNIANYNNLPELIKIGLEYLSKTDFSVLDNGRHDILGDKIFVLIQDYMSKSLEEGKFEAHRKYTDIQYIIEGQEQIGIGDIKDLAEEFLYDENKDIVFLTPKNNDIIKFIILKEKDFAIFTPRDVHKPSIAVNRPSYVKKAVIKVLNIETP